MQLKYMVYDLNTMVVVVACGGDAVSVRAATSWVIKFDC